MSARLLVVAVVLASAGCASTAPSWDASPWTTGRLSVRVEASAERPLQNLSAAFELRGDGTSGELRLLSPLGTLLAAARWVPGGAFIRTPEGERGFDNLDELSRQALGESLPLAALPDWLAGRPWPTRPYNALSGGFEQLGWIVQTERLAEGWIAAQRSAPPAVELRVKLDRGEP